MEKRIRTEAELIESFSLTIVTSITADNRPYLESAIFETCMISTFILLSFESKL